MRQSDLEDRTISSVKSGHLTSVICGQPTSALTQAADRFTDHVPGKIVLPVRLCIRPVPNLRKYIGRAHLRVMVPIEK
jgi:hypothetical protein